MSRLLNIGHTRSSGFAPYDDPQIAVAVVIEKGGSGAALASTAVDIVNSYFSQEEIGAVIIGENTLLK